MVNSEQSQGMVCGAQNRAKVLIQIKELKCTPEYRYLGLVKGLKPYSKRIKATGS